MIHHRKYTVASRTGGSLCEARRRHIHGPVLPMRPEGEPSLLAGTFIVLLGFVLIAGLVFIAAPDASASAHTATGYGASGGMGKTR
jgi:hypothetical protein